MYSFKSPGVSLYCFLVLPSDRESIVGGYWKDSVRIVLLYKKQEERGNGMIKKKKSRQILQSNRSFRCPCMCKTNKFRIFFATFLTLFDFNSYFFCNFTTDSQSLEFSANDRRVLLRHTSKKTAYAELRIERSEMAKLDKAGNSR